MTNKDFITYARKNGLTPLAWFNITYPAYAVKIKFKYPTSNPDDFRDRALLELIDLGIPYSTACALLMIKDPHEAILQRFKSSESTPQLVHFDKKLNRLALTPVGRMRVQNEILTRDGIATSFIDGFSSEPFPIDVVKSLTDGRYDKSDVVRSPSGDFPFDPDIDRSLIKLNRKLIEGKGHDYHHRLGIPANAMETQMSHIDTNWITNLAIGVFLKDSRIVRRIFCDKNPNPVSPFGWLQNLDGFKLTINGGKFGYTKIHPATSDLFKNLSEKDFTKIVMSELKSAYGNDFSRECTLGIASDTGQVTLHVSKIGKESKNRRKLFPQIKEGIMPIPMNGIVGSLFIRVTGDDSLLNLAKISSIINQSDQTWIEIIDGLKYIYPDNWRRILVDIDRHDLLFRYDVERFIHYGK